MSVIDVRPICNSLEMNQVMSQNLVEMAKSLVEAQIQAGHVTPENMQDALRTTFDSLSTLKSREDQREEGHPTPAAAMDWRKSIARHAIVCLECGVTFKQLSRRHLLEHDLTPRTYRAKYGIPRQVSLAARDTTARRRRIVQETRPWEQTPRYLKAQQKQRSRSTRRSKSRKNAT